MSIKDTLLSRLFGLGPDDEESGPEVQQETEEQSASPPPGPDPLQLQLAPEHAVYRLWNLRKEQSGWLPSPIFRLEVPDSCQVASEVGRELARLQLAVNMAANQRLAEAVPKRGKETGEDIPASPNLDAQAVAFLSNDRMLAWLFAFPPVGQGAELSRETLEKALEEKQVRFGVEEALLDRLPEDPDRYFHLFFAACGKRAEDGKDGYVVDLFPRNAERMVTMDEFNRVDYASLSFVQNVEQGGVICRIIPPTSGVEGRTVLDQEIPAKNGKPATAPKGRNTELSEDGKSLLASRTGHVEFNGRTFQVKPVLEIGGNVDFSTGNLNFLGDVHIHGDICAGFVVRAMGNITVDGVVEACTVEAGGDLVMVKGAQGGNQAVLRASHSIYAKYLENCCVYAKENLQTDCIINCDVYCDGGVEVRSGRGTIIGGSIRAAHEVSARVVGARSECHTDIFLGGLPCQDFDQELLLREINGLQEEMDRVEQQPDSPTKLSRLAKLRMQISLSRMKLEQALKDLELLGEVQEEPGIRRLVCDVAYAGTSVTIDQAFRRLQQEVRPCLATLVEGEIRLA